MNDLTPYSADELRHMRRLILAAGFNVDDWTQRLRRSADFIQSLSPAQAGIVAEQASAIAAACDDIGTPAEMDAALAEVGAVPEPDRQTYIAKQIIQIRRQHYPGPLNE